MSAINYCFVCTKTEVKTKTVSSRYPCSEPPSPLRATTALDVTIDEAPCIKNLATFLPAPCFLTVKTSASKSTNRQHWCAFFRCFIKVRDWSKVENLPQGRISLHGPFSDVVRIELGEEVKMTGYRSA